MNIKDLAKRYKLPQKVVKKVMKANSFTTKNQVQMKRLDMYLQQEMVKVQMAMRNKLRPKQPGAGELINN